MAGQTPAAAGAARDLVRQARLQKGGLIRVIIQTKGPASGSLQRAIGSGGGKVGRSLGSGSGFVADLPPELVRVLAGRTDVLHISPDRVVRGNLDLEAQATGAYLARNTTSLDGRGIGVAIVDSGIAPAPELTSPVNRIVAWADFVNGRQTPYDDYGHGTHVAGIVID